MVVFRSKSVPARFDDKRHSLPADFNDDIHCYIPPQITKNYNNRRVLTRALSYSVSFKGTNMTIPLQSLQNFKELPVVKETAALLTSEFVSPQDCNVTHQTKRDKAMAKGFRYNVAALDLPQPPLMVWLLQGDSTTYYVFGMIDNDGKNRYITFNEYEKPFRFETNENDPNTINLSGVITDRRVFFLDSSDRLVVAYTGINNVNATYNTQTDEVDANSTGEGWNIKF